MDFYNDLLPIWSAVRERIEMTFDENYNCYKLIIFSRVKIDTSINNLFKEYCRENVRNEPFNNPTEKEIMSNKFKIVTFYENKIRNNNNLPIPMTNEEYNQLIVDKNNNRNTYKTNIEFCRNKK